MMESIKEEWKDIEGFQSRYKISSFGNVLSMNYNSPTKVNIIWRNQ